MSTKKVILGLVLMVAVAVVAAPSYVSAMNDDVTVATFHQPVEIPGLVLPAGTYLFQAFGPVVQIWNADRSTLYATLMTIPAYRPEADGKTEFELGERGAGSPKAIEAWYAQGGTVGEEFVYPKAPEPPFPNSTYGKDPSTHWWRQSN